MAGHSENKMFGLLMFLHSNGIMLAKGRLCKASLEYQKNNLSFCASNMGQWNYFLEKCIKRGHHEGFQKMRSLVQRNFGQSFRECIAICGVLMGAMLKVNRIIQKYQLAECKTCLIFPIMLDWITPDNSRKNKSRQPCRSGFFCWLVSTPRHFNSKLWHNWVRKAVWTPFIDL